MDAYKVYISKIITSYTTYEHVPATWQVGHSLTSIYSLSCFLYCINGFIIMNLTSTYPEYFEIEEIIDPRDTRPNLCRWAELVYKTLKPGAVTFSYRP